MLPVSLRRAAGFTLIELMVTLMVAAILLTIAVPSFRNYQASQQVRGASGNLATALTFARSEAVKRRANVCVRPDQSSDWATGWVVALGTSANCAGAVLQRFPAIAHVTLSPDPVSSAVGYNRDGRASSSIAFTLAADDAAATERCVRVGTSGTAKSVAGACS